MPRRLLSVQHKRLRKSMHFLLVRQTQPSRAREQHPSLRHLMAVVGLHAVPRDGHGRVEVGKCRAAEGLALVYYCARLTIHLRQLVPLLVQDVVVGVDEPGSSVDVHPSHPSHHLLIIVPVTLDWGGNCKWRRGCNEDALGSRAQLKVRLLRLHGDDSVGVCVCSDPEPLRSRHRPVDRRHDRGIPAHTPSLLLGPRSRCAPGLGESVSEGGRGRELRGRDMVCTICYGRWS